MGRKLVLTGTKLSNLSAPILPNVDAILPTAGALALIDPTHPYQPWAAGKPAHATRLPNLAAPQLAQLTGEGGNNLLPLYEESTAWNADRHVAKRSTKGGMYFGIDNTVTNVGAEASVGFTNNGLARNFVLNNKSHSYYLAVWGRWTRTVGAITGGSWRLTRTVSSGDNLHVFTRPAAGETGYPTTPNRIGHEAVNMAAPMLGPWFQDVAVSNIADIATYTDWKPISAVNNAAGNGNVGMSPAFMFYGYYLEDLTVSGRTYAQVNSLVKDKFSRDVVQPGGRYYGDTVPA